MYYLATPYSDLDPTVMEARYLLAMRAQYYLTLQTGKAIFSPIVLYHKMALRFDMPKTADYWFCLNKEYIKSSIAILFCSMPGYEQSSGMFDEFVYAATLSKPRFLVNADDWHGSKHFSLTPFQSIDINWKCKKLNPSLEKID
jgi:hypothetical protein